MKRRTGVGVAMLLWLGITGAALAAEPRPQVYIFGTTSCHYCQNALMFLRKISRDQGGFDLHEFDVVRSSDHATLFARFITALGMREAHIPMVVVGRDVMLGYDTDDTSGRDMQSKIDACRVEACLDVMGIFMRGGGSSDVVSSIAWTEHRRFVAASERKPTKQKGGREPALAGRSSAHGAP